MNSKAIDFQRKFDKELKTGLISLLVLLTIIHDPEPSYGYRIIKTLETLSNGRFKFPEGTIYPILSSLQNKGLLTSYWGDAPEGPRRKYYKLTTDGSRALKLCLADWKNVVSITDDLIKQLRVKTRKK
jgi:PadR family transcriptional regulator PadR